MVFVRISSGIMVLSSLRDLCTGFIWVMGILFLWGCDRISSGVMGMSSLRDLFADFIRGVMSMKFLRDLD